MKNEFLRHTLATIAYRFQKSILHSTEEFGDFTLGNGSRKVVEIIHHMNDVLAYTRTYLEKQIIDNSPYKMLDLRSEIEQFYHTLKAIDVLLLEHKMNIDVSKKLLQGPLSDTLTHIGQISMLSRMYGTPIPKEDFSAACISTGILNYNK